MDLTAGVRIDDLRDGGVVRGTVGKEPVVLVRKGERVFAVGARCTHYHGALDEGLVVGDTIRCPLHHACFDLASGEALRAPALDPIPCWNVERRGEMVFVRDKVQPRPRSTESQKAHPSSIVIVGGGAAGLAAADMLRRREYAGPVTLLSADADPPVDRPNLSKDYLAGEAQDDWMPLWPAETYAERQVRLVLGAQVTSIDPVARTVSLANGGQEAFGALLLATGAEPVHLPIPGADDTSVLYLRSFADCRAIVERVKGASRVVVVGASFIGLEVAASLRARGIAVDVVAPDHQPLERVLGAEIGRFVRTLHESHGVAFHLGETVVSMSGRTIHLSGGGTLEADFAVLGVGVRPTVELAQRAGLAVDRGVLVNEFLETSAPGIFAAGDIARWPDPHSGERIRVEHWVVAMRQGQTAAQNMLGARVRFDAVPYFWSQHYDVTIRYVGHAERWDEVRIDGSLDQRDATASFLSQGRRVAAATVSRDRASLEIEVQLEAIPPHVGST
jgi:NADPH-dependent 2,4-dienoyl-CoA reductase/sulfur reductase-like enzyme/nitrite reductase/ring-hydroxylating ferredoxin subunit